MKRILYRTIIIGMTGAAALGLTSTAAQALPRQECQDLVSGMNFSYGQFVYWAQFGTNHYNPRLSRTYLDEYEYERRIHSREC